MTCSGSHPAAHSPGIPDINAVRTRTAHAAPSPTGPPFIPEGARSLIRSQDTGRRGTGPAWQGPVGDPACWLAPGLRRMWSSHRRPRLTLLSRCGAARRLRGNMTNRLSGLLRTDLPIVLGPFGGLSSVDLTATVSNGGGLGSYGLYGYTADRIRDTDTLLRAATDRPYALNMSLPTGTERDPTPRHTIQSRPPSPNSSADSICPSPSRPDRYLPSFQEQIENRAELSPHRSSASSTESHPQASSPAPTTTAAPSSPRRPQ